MTSLGQQGHGSAAGTERPAYADEVALLQTRFDAACAYLHLDDSRTRLEALEKEVEAPDLWNDADHAREVTTQYGRLKSDVDEIEIIGTRLSDLAELIELANEEGPAALEELAGELDSSIAVSGKALDDIELRTLFSGEHDERDAIVELHAGAGGTDAQDWAEVMLRMYMRWAERRGFTVEVEETSAGQEAGILSATFIIHGRHAYGMMSSERGVHRLVRMSPFDSQHRRQTSFASFELTPFLEDEAVAEVDEKDLRVDTYRSSGAGGQHVNVTDSAVRLTHLPTGIVVAVQNERSQHQNKAKAMQILGAKLIDRQNEERKAEMSALAGPQTDVAWGNQIRSYVMAPYQLVKDLRTEYETGNVDAVLDGDLDEFMVSYLRWRRSSNRNE